MRLIQKLLALTSFSLIALCASASPLDPVEGVEFQRLPQAQPTEAGKKLSAEIGIKPLKIVGTVWFCTVWNQVGPVMR